MCVGGGGGGERIYTVTTRMTPGIRWTAEKDSVKISDQASACAPGTTE